MAGSTEAPCGRDEANDGRSRLATRLRARLDGDRERGAVLLIAAFALIVVVATAAVVVDLAAARADRSDAQVAVDATAAAAGQTLVSEGPRAACEAAFAYLDINLATELRSPDCSALPTSCSETTSSTEVVAVSQGVVATVVHPVDDTHAVMRSTSLGHRSIAITAADGERCERFGVELSVERRHFFGGFVGATDGSMNVHSVVRASQDDAAGRAINLLLLERTECGILVDNGGGSSGGLIVRATTDPATGEVHPGFIAADSAGTEGCSSSGVVDANGAGATIRADGPAGCDGELSPGTGAGCGVLEVFAADGAGCEMPACSSSGQVAPPPTPLAKRITRAPIDHRWNCKAAYPTDLGIAGCDDTLTSAPWIDQLRAELGGLYPPIGYQDYVAAGMPCTVGGGPSTAVTIPAGNWWIDCDLDVRRSLTFEGGNLVVTGDIGVGANGVLSLNTANPETYDWSSPQAFDPYEHSANAGVLVVQSGEFSKAGGAEVHIPNTTVYLGEGASVKFTGGDGALVWSAPTEGPFADLAFWSDSAEDFRFAGNAMLEMTGVFFAPEAHASFQGNGGTQQVEAQFITRSLTLGGNGALDLAPEFDRMVLVASDGSSQVIR